MGPEMVKSVDSMEHLLALSGGDTALLDQYSEAGEEAEIGSSQLIGRGPEGCRPGDRVDHLLSSVKSSGASLDCLPR